MYLVVVLIIIANAYVRINGECQWEDSFIGDGAKYYVVGLYKMYTDYDKSEYDENAVRLHLKLR